MPEQFAKKCLINSVLLGIYNEYMSICPALRETKMEANLNHSGIAPSEEVKYSGQSVEQKVVHVTVSLLSNRPECALTGNVGPKHKHDWFEFQNGDHKGNSLHQVVLSFFTVYFDP